MAGCGAGSAAFIAGVLVAGQIAGVWGLPSILGFTAASLLAAALSARFAPGLAYSGNTPIRKGKVIEQDWLVLLLRHGQSPPFW